MSEKETIEILLSELRRGTLVLSVLCRLKRPMYGYSLIGEMAEAGVKAEAGTLYPLLRRLEKQGLLESNWEIGAKPRKYYQLSLEGARVLEILLAEWHALSAAIQTIAEEA